MSIYAMGLVLGLLQTRQMLGTRGMSQSYALGASTFSNVIATIISLSKLSEREISQDLVTDCLIKVWVIRQNI